MFCTNFSLNLTYFKTLGNIQTFIFLKIHYLPLGLLGEGYTKNSQIWLELGSFWRNHLSVCVFFSRKDCIKCCNLLIFTSYISFKYFICHVWEVCTQWSNYLILSDSRKTKVRRRRQGHRSRENLGLHELFFPCFLAFVKKFFFKLSKKEWYFKTCSSWQQ